jgi:hypothetical protein
MYSVEIRVMNEQGEQEGDLLSVIFDTLDEATGAARNAFETGLKDCPDNTDNSQTIGQSVRSARAGSGL